MQKKLSCGCGGHDTAQVSSKPSHSHSHHGEVELEAKELKTSTADRVNNTFSLLITDLTRDEAPNCQEVLPHLLIGPTSSSLDLTFLRKHNVSHIVSLHPTTHFDDIRYLPLEDVLDKTTAQVLHLLPLSHEFIDRALANHETVLVHSKRGVSRSAAFVIAYVMKLKKLPVLRAVQFVMGHRAWIKPNDGFLFQLSLYQALGYDLETHGPLHQYARLLCFSFLSDNQALSSASSPSLRTLPVTSESSQHAYLCRQCCIPLVDSSSVVPHYVVNSVGELHQGKEVRFSVELDKIDQASCEFVHVEPAEWMLSAIVTGKHGVLVCPNPGCRQELGSFNWLGKRCSCKFWHKPAFQLVAARLSGARPLASSQGDDRNSQPSSSTVDAADNPQSGPNTTQLQTAQPVRINLGGLSGSQQTGFRKKGK